MLVYRILKYAPIYATNGTTNSSTVRKQHSNCRCCHGSYWYRNACSTTIGCSLCIWRPEPKNTDAKNQIEGHLHPDKKTVVVEDLISTGKSSLNAVAALRKADAQVMGMIALFTYGFSQASEAFEAHQLPLHTLSDYTTLIAAAEANKNRCHNLSAFNYMAK